MSKNLFEQRVLMGIDDWDRRRPATREEAKAHKSKTATYIGDAMEALKNAKRAAAQRKLGKSDKGTKRLIDSALESCRRAHEACYEKGETYEVAEDVEDLHEVSAVASQARRHLDDLEGARDKKKSLRALAGLVSMAASFASKMGERDSARQLWKVNKTLMKASNDA